MRPEKLYLVDIVEAVAAIERFLAGIGRDEFTEDDLRQSAVLQKLMVIGEAAPGYLSSSGTTTRMSNGGISWGFATLPCTSTSPSIGLSSGSLQRRTRLSYVLKLRR